MRLPENPPSAEHVLLLHGLMTAPPVMSVLGRRLARQGFVVHYFGYRSLRRPMAHHVARLAAWQAEWQAQYGGERWHGVGHSLGGLLVRAFAAAYPDRLNGRCLTLGTPHQGSALARAIQARHPWCLGQSYHQALDGDVPPWPSACEWGSVAGSHGLGVGRMWGLGTALTPGDGTVAVGETVAVGCRDHLVLPVSHTGMLLDAEVAAQAGHFLRHGCFRHTTV